MNEMMRISPDHASRGARQGTGAGALRDQRFARCPRARSCAHSMRLDRERGMGPVGPGSSEGSGEAMGWDA